LPARGGTYRYRLSELDDWFWPSEHRCFLRPTGIWFFSTRRSPAQAARGHAVRISDMSGWRASNSPSPPI